VRPLVILLAVIMCHRVAVADVPWAQGVAKDKQTQANALFAEGNELFAQQAHAPALEKYKAAVTLWDHPLIEFNMAVTLVRLDRILGAADALDKALRFGEAPFPSAEQYQQALDYKKLIAGRVGTLQLSCDARATVLLDGQAWLTCPGNREARVLAGEHVIVAEREGYYPLTRHVLVPGGGTAHEALSLVRLDRVKLVYPTPRWVPWAIAGGGLAVTLGGLGFYVAGNNQMDRFEANFAMLCPTGCSTDLDATPTERQLSEQRDSARLKGAVGVSMMAVGGAVVVGGVVWAILNKPHRVLPKMEVTPTTGGASATIGWQF